MYMHTLKRFFSIFHTHCAVGPVAEIIPFIFFHLIFLLWNIMVQITNLKLIVGKSWNKIFRNCILPRHSSSALKFRKSQPHEWRPFVDR